LHLCFDDACFDDSPIFSILPLFLSPRKAGALQNSTGQCLRQRPWSA
jgi:hypothetical protein